MRILLTNDDGPFAEGLASLRAVLERYGQVEVVCPEAERSGTGHSITYMVPVRARRVALPDGEPATLLTGTPADCVRFAVLELPGERPDLVVSGPNLGLNAGVDLFYSGTVAATLEGGICGIKSIAISVSRHVAAERGELLAQAERALRLLLEEDCEDAVVWNVNIPRLNGREPEIRFTSQSSRFPNGSYVCSHDSRARSHYWLDTAAHPPPAPPGSDVEALEQGAISITPLRLELTHREALDRLTNAARYSV